jgi:hypothetical protein
MVWPPALDRLLRSLIRLATLVLQKKADPDEAFETPFRTDQEEFLRTGHYFPNFPVKFKLRRYEELTEDAGCEKDARSGMELGAG